MFLALTLCQILSVFLLLICSLLTNSILALPWLSLGSGDKWELGDSMVKYGETSMVERIWWNEVLLVSSFAEAFFFGVINVLLHGVINVLVYEAPKELS